MELHSLALAGVRAGGAGALLELAEWVNAYPMNSHPDLGRPGPVCPFTRLAKKHDTIRLRLSPATPDDEEEAFGLLHRGFDEIDEIPAKREAKLLRVLVAGFPNCDSDEGVAMLLRAQRRLRFRAMLRFRMMGFMHPRSESEGLWNPAFRPLRAPMPVIAIRYLVEQDAPFIARQHLQWAPYLLRYGLRGARRLHDVRRGKAVPD
jgi:hypothetical protein